ncbi:MAG: acetyl-CoA carboxylase biotin carboxyl carrier protein subunit [Anaerolineae bacterium]|nr:acetyl-CoA carboxylase biotin carboxyl carrier protein subunit [Anaerolineae bacterium]
MKREFTLTLENVEYPVVADGDTITVNGRPFTVEIADDPSTALRQGSGQGSGQGGAVLVDGIAYDVTLEGETATVGEESYAVHVTGLAVTPVAAVAAPAPAVEAAGAGAVLAIMPGKIIRVLVEVGQQVKDGQPVCVLEAMKMENELHAHQSGAVQAVHVRPGDDVEKDQVLVEIE